MSRPMYAVLIITEFLNSPLIQPPSYLEDLDCVPGSPLQSSHPVNDVVSSALVVLVFKRVLRISNVPTFLKSKVKNVSMSPIPSQDQLSLLLHLEMNWRFYRTNVKMRSAVSTFRQRASLGGNQSMMIVHYQSIPSIMFRYALGTKPNRLRSGKQ